MANRIAVVISQGQSQNPAKRGLEEDIIASLLMESGSGIDVTVIPHLYDLKADGTGMLALDCQAAPTADFSSSPLGACADVVSVQFEDRSLNLSTAWSWNLGDGTTSTSQNPSHTYGASGSYTVTLSVTDNDGNTDDIARVVSVTNPGAPTNLLDNPGFEQNFDN